MGIENAQTYGMGRENAIRNENLVENRRLSFSRLYRILYDCLKNCSGRPEGFLNDQRNRLSHFHGEKHKKKLEGKFSEFFKIFVAIWKKLYVSNRYFPSTGQRAQKSK